MAAPVNDLGVIAHWADLVKIFGVFFGAISGLVTWAWWRLNKDVEHLTKQLEEQRAEGTIAHNEIFTLLREMTSVSSTIRADLSKLQGEHDNQIRGGGHG